LLYLNEYCILFKIATVLILCFYCAFIF
jgi:hypothetical protein